MNIKEVIKDGWQCPKCTQSHRRYAGEPDPVFKYLEFGFNDSILDAIEVSCTRCGYSILVTPADRKEKLCTDAKAVTSGCTPT